MRVDTITRDAVSIAVATGFYAVSFGVLSVTAGFTVAQTCVMSLAVFTGASQFTYVSVLGAGGTTASALPPALLLAARNAVYGLTLRGVTRAGPRRALDAHLVLDESTAMAHAQRDAADKRRAFVSTGVAVFVCWNAGTLAGALAGGLLTDPRAFGLDAIFPAVFLALLVPQLRSGRAIGAALAGGLVALVLLPFAPPGVPVMAAVLACLPFVRGGTA